MEKVAAILSRKSRRMVTKFGKPGKDLLEGFSIGGVLGLALALVESMKTINSSCFASVHLSTWGGG